MGHQNYVLLCTETTVSNPLVVLYSNQSATSIYSEVLDWVQDMFIWFFIIYWKLTNHRLYIWTISTDSLAIIWQIWDWYGWSSVNLSKRDDAAFSLCTNSNIYVITTTVGVTVYREFYNSNLLTNGLLINCIAFNNRKFDYTRGPRTSKF